MEFKLSWKRGLAAVIGVVLFLGHSAWAVTDPTQVESVPEIPAYVTDAVVMARLAAEREQLLQRMRDVIGAGESINRDCRDVVVGSAADRSCAQRFDQHVRDKAAYNRDARAFKAELARARWSRGQWVRGISVANILGGCTTTWHCRSGTSIMRSPDSRLFTSPNKTRVGAAK